MAICYHGDGKLLLNADKEKEFTEKFMKLAKLYDEEMMFLKFSCNENNLMEFSNYARHYFINDLIDMLNENIDCIKCGEVWFSCYDEDSFNDKEGFPFMEFYEIKDGILYEQTLYKRLTLGWERGKYENCDEVLDENHEITTQLDSEPKSDDLPF